MTSKINRFIPLRNYTQYSLSKGALRINELIDFCKKENINFLIRGIRNEIDFTYEKDIANANRELDNNIETIFFISSPSYSHISSKIVREIIKNNGDISKFVSYSM